ncbi:hypothetical protein ACJX0J_011781, partial [Zea mays]
AKHARGKDGAGKPIEPARVDKMMMAEVVANHSKRSHTDGYFSAKAAVAAAAAASPPEELGSMPMSSKKPRPRNSNSPRTAPVSPKEKKDRIGERVAALQQLVSPFGKTDTASVLQEASGYIRFLHQQLQVGVPPVTARMVAGTTSSAPLTCVLLRLPAPRL